VSRPSYCWAVILPLFSPPCWHAPFLPAPPAAAKPDRQFRCAGRLGDSAGPAGSLRSRGACGAGVDFPTPSAARDGWPTRSGRGRSAGGQSLQGTSARFVKCQIKLRLEQVKWQVTPMFLSRTPTEHLSFRLELTGRETVPEIIRCSDVRSNTLKVMAST
jgi:hypothetical protein